MKEPLKKFWKNHWKPVIAVIVLTILVVGIVVYNNWDPKNNPVEVVADTGMIGANISEEPQITEEITSAVVEKSTVKPEGEDKNNTKPNNEDSNEKGTTEKQSEEPEATSTTMPTVNPVQENKYVPISEGWKASETAKGDITSAQKADIDSMIESWKSGTMSDTELKEKIVSYLEEQGIEYMEVSITSKGYALYDALPEVDLRDGGNLYSFVGTYSTGKQNPDGTNKTVCYNWSAFVF